MRVEPTNDFWAGIATSIGRSSGEWVVGVVGVVALAVIVAKYVLPVWRDYKESAAEPERRRLDLAVKAQGDNDARARDRIRLTERQLEVQASQTRAIECLSEQTAILNGQLEQSKAASARMGQSVSEIGVKVERIDHGVDELKDMVSRISATD